MITVQKVPLVPKEMTLNKEDMKDYKPKQRDKKIDDTFQKMLEEDIAILNKEDEKEYEIE